MIVETAAFSHQGGREEQQDAYASFAGRDGYLLVVADGMGGHAGGRIAAAKVVETARRLWQAHQQSPLGPRQLLKSILRESHAAINAAGLEAGLTPRSTAAVLHLGPARAHWAHVGDSRIYRFRNGTLRERTRDHSVVQMLVDLGKVAEEDMGRHPDQNRLTQSLGGDGAPMPDLGVEDLQPGDAFVLCSDGLWEVVAPDEMREALSKPTLENGLAEGLAARAFERAGPRSDNITLVLARVRSSVAADVPTVPLDTGARAAPSREPGLRNIAPGSSDERPTVPLASMRSRRSPARRPALVAALLAVLIGGGALAVYRSLHEIEPAVTKPGTPPPPSVEAAPAPKPGSANPSPAPARPEAPRLPREDSPKAEPSPSEGVPGPRPAEPPAPPAERRSAAPPTTQPPSPEQPGAMTAPEVPTAPKEPGALPQQPRTEPAPERPDAATSPPSAQSPEPPPKPETPGVPQQ
jgi:serine/threonine protein phosphatase PrpC